MFVHRASTICWRSIPEPMLTWICHMPRLATVLVYSCYCMLSYKSIKAASVSSRVCEGVQVAIQVWWMLRRCLFIATYAIRMKPVRDLSCRKLLEAFATVVLYTNLMLICNKGRMGLLYNRVSTLF